MQIKMIARSTDRNPAESVAVFAGGCL